MYPRIVSTDVSPPQQEWMRARAMTEAADKESAEAEVSSQRAARELAASEKAEEAVRRAQEKHQEVPPSCIARLYRLVASST